MHLMDCVCQAPSSIRIDDGYTGKQISMPGAGMFRDEIAQVPVRYLLDDAVTAACVEMVANRQDFLIQSLDIVRAPYQEFWLEWNEAVRADVYSEKSENGLNSISGKAGMLVKLDETGRAGCIRMFWSGDGLSADVSPAIFRFDLDAQVIASVEMKVQTGNEVLQALFDRVSISLDPAWRSYYYQRARSDAHLRGILSDAIAPTVFDFPFMLSFALILMAHTHDFQASDLSALNRSRVRKGRQELLDYLKVTQEIFGVSERHGASVSAGNHTGSRLHLVRGHLVRRGDKVFWRTTHFRGRMGDAPLRRTVSLVFGKVA